jgi:hypothetical protein
MLQYGLKKQNGKFNNGRTIRICGRPVFLTREQLLNTVKGLAAILVFLRI